MARGLRLVFVPALLCLAAGPAAARFPDDPAEFLIDISEEVGSPTGLLVKARKHLWQLPNSQIRKGHGLAWFSIAKNSTNDSEARIFVEVEAMDGRSLFDASTEIADGLEEFLGAAQVRLAGEVRRGDGPETLTISGKKLKAFRLEFSIDVINAVPRTVDPCTMLVLNYKGALITITVENYSSTQQYLDPFLKSMSVVSLPKQSSRPRLKLVDATGGIYRYVTAPLPKGMQTDCANCAHGVVARFARPAPKSTDPLAALSLTQSEFHRRNELSEEVNRRRSELLDMYDAVSDPEEIKIAGRSGLLITYVDRSEDDAPGVHRAARAYVKLFDRIWTWTWVSFKADEKRFSKERTEFDKILGSADMWHAKPSD